MTLSEFTINSIKEFISGDHELTPYLTGSKIVALFNDAGIREVYKNGMPEGMSRNAYVVAKLKQINGTKNLVKLIERCFDPRHYVNNPDLDLTESVEAFNPLILKDGCRLEKISDVYKVVGYDLPDEVDIEVHFEEIQSQIVEQIRNAQFMIWVAVAWFTDKTLAKELYRKLNEGVMIRIITLDDEVNNKYGVKLERAFEVKRVKPTGIYKNIMHHKFCVIDLKTVVHGSYNWTNKAQYNKETITIDTGREIAEKFAREFKSLFSN